MAVVSQEKKLKKRIDRLEKEVKRLKEENNKLNNEIAEKNNIISNCDYAYEETRKARDDYIRMTKVAIALRDKYKDAIARAQELEKEYRRKFKKELKSIK